MEDENYRSILLPRLNRRTDRATAPDDHMQDVCVRKAVYKGLLRVTMAIIHGLEASMGNAGVGGLGSAFQVLEIAHTHFWTKDMLDSMEMGLMPSAGPTAPTSREASPFGSRESLAGPGSLEVPHRPGDARSRTSSQEDREPGDGSSTAEILRELIQQKKHLLLGRLSSLDSGAESDGCSSVAASEAGSITTNPAFQRGRGLFSSIRSAVSETDLDGLAGSPSPGRQPWPAKCAGSSGFRYRHELGLVPTGKSPSPETGRSYLFEGVLHKDRSAVWDNPQFWEDMFLDAVAQEREAIGLDSGPTEMVERYRGLGPQERRRLEHDEDRLLSTMLFNLVAFMVMMQMKKDEIKRKVRRLLGKSHIGLIYSQEITQLLENLNNLTANDIDLKQLLSRQVRPPPLPHITLLAPGPPAELHRPLWHRRRRRDALP
jgi:hypothetical protein